MSEIITTNKDAERSGRFAAIALPTLVYAAIFTACLYNVGKGVGVALFAVATIAYLYYVYHRRLKENSWFDLVCQLTFIGAGVSCFVSDNDTIYCFSWLAMFAMLLVITLRLNYDCEQWDFYKQITAMLQTIGGTVSCLFQPVCDAISAMNTAKGRHGKKVIPVLIGVLIGLPLVIIMAKLLADADMVFDALLSGLLNKIFVPENIIMIILLFLFAFFNTYAGIAYLAKKRIKEQAVDHQTGNADLAFTVNLMLAILYVIFSSIQIIYLFAGHMQLPAGITYAEYARSGFFQLLGVCSINIIIVLVTALFFKPDRRVRAALTVICACTYIMVFSSGWRMSLYIQAYGLTELRVLVLWALAVISITMAGLIVYVYDSRFKLFKFVAVSLAVCYLILAYSRPDSIIASYNIKHQKCDSNSIAALSDDAAGIILTSDNVTAWYSSRFGNADYDKTAAWSFGYIDKMYNHYVEDNYAEYRPAGLNYNLSKSQASQLINDLYSRLEKGQ